MKTRLAKLFLKRLNNWGFKFHHRDCHQASDYGGIDEQGMFMPDDEMVEERWSNKEFINWLLDVDDKELNGGMNELNKLLKIK